MKEDITVHQDRPERAVRTSDGSFTFYSAHFNQHYHSQFGAETESKYVFLKGCRVESFLEKNGQISVFELGFGTGLNFLITAELVQQHGGKLNFYSVEKFPLTLNQILEFDYLGRFDKGLLVPFLTQYETLSPGWNQISISDVISLHLFVGDFSELSFSECITFDAFFQDAFSPDVNADLWTQDCFSRLHSWSHSESLLSTYCSATMARAAMAKAGWFPCRFPGGVGKREMTVAFVSSENADLPMLNVEKLIQKWDNRE